MIYIKPVPVGYPVQEANAINIRIMPFQTTDTKCSTYYELINSTVTYEEGNPITINITLADGNSPITEAQFAAWGSDNTYIEDIVLANLQLERL